jgi:hypothetical protein
LRHEVTLAASARCLAHARSTREPLHISQEYRIESTVQAKPSSITSTFPRLEALDIITFTLAQRSSVRLSGREQLHSSTISVGTRCLDCNHEWRFEMPVTAESTRYSGTHRVITP